MAQTIKQFIDANKGKVIGWAECLAAFWRGNLDTNKGEAYSAVGACDLWPLKWSTYDKIARNAGRYGDWGIWSGTEGAYVNYDPKAGRGYGHVALFLRDNGNGTGQFMSQNPGPFQELTLSYTGLLGFLRGKGVATGITPAPAPAPAALVNRRVTNPVAWVRTAPRSNAPLAPGYPNGVAKGTNIAVKGFVVGENPYGSTPPDNAWYVTKSGFYVWANAAENTVKGLKKL